MERQTQPRTAQQAEQTRLPAEQARTPERARLSDASLTARLALDGVSLLDMPPQRLEELAAWIGNSGMQALLDVQTPRMQEAAFRMPGQEPETSPFQVEPGQPLALVQPEGLTAVERPGAASDPVFSAG